MNTRRETALGAIGLWMLAMSSVFLWTQQPHSDTGELTGHVELPKGSSHAGHSPAVVIWLTPENVPEVHAPDPGHFTLAQKNRMFSPHLLVIPVGSTVTFPNGDPFFHNVFSLFNGKRFDLGLYEAGSSRDVVFSREGVSYIFCNIHPEMSAVVIALSTPLYAIADGSQQFTMHAPPGNYLLHAWIEGTPQPDLDRLKKHIHIREGISNSVVVDASSTERTPADHLNKFGKPYDRDTKPAY